MVKHREEGEVVGDSKEPMKEAGKGSSKTKTLGGEDANTDENPINGGLVSGDGSLKEEGGNTGDSVSSDGEQVKADDEKTLSSDDVERSEDVSEPETERHDMECDVEDETVKSGENGASAGEEETVITAGKEVIDEKAKCEVEDNGGAPAAEQKKKLKIKLKLSVAEDKAGQEKGATKKSEENDKKMGVDSKQAEENVGVDKQADGSEAKDDAKDSEPAQVLEESTQLSKGEANEENPSIVSEASSPAELRHEEEIINANQNEDKGEAMDIDCVAEEQVEKNVTGASVMPNPDVPIAEADKNDSSVAKEMEIDEQKDNADSANPNTTTEDAITGEVEPLDHNALFDPSSDITNFIDFSGVSSWSGNIQDLKTETGIVSLTKDKKPTDTAEEVATVDCDETHKSVDATINADARVTIGAESPAAATDCSKEAPDAILGSENNLEDKDHQCVDKKTADHKDTMREEDNITQEAPNMDANQKEDTEMEENPSNSDYGTDSGIKTNGVKRKADVLNEDSPGEGRRTVSFAKVSFAERPSFKIGACIARAASQMAGSPSVLKGGNVSDETLSVESFVSQLYSAATNPDKENVVSEIATGFFLDFRNSSAVEQVTPEKASSKRGRPSNAGGTEAFEFEELGDTYWTDRVIHNGGEEQTPPTEKGYQIVPVDLKPAQVQRTRRPYKRRKSLVSNPSPASDKPANFDENAPAELIMKFSETDAIPPEKNLSKMFRHFGPIRESQTDVDRENNRARVVFRKGVDAGIAYNSAGKFNIFGTKAVKYELSYTITETFKVQPYVVSLGEEEAAACPPA